MTIEKIEPPVSTNVEKRFWFNGTTYKITFMDGKSIVGKLLAVDRYNVIVRWTNDEGQSVDIMCYKHAMARAYPVTAKETGKTKDEVVRTQPAG